MASLVLMPPAASGPKMWTYGDLTLERFKAVTCRGVVTESASKVTSVKPNPPDAHISDLPRALGSGITQTYQECDSSFQYSNHYAPRRIFTKLIEPCKNDGYDNAEGDFICRVNDVIANPEGYGYEIADRLGHGTFGQVLRCVTCDNRSVAVKIIKNKPAYFQQALVEVRILQLLNRYYDTRIVKMMDYFVYRKHLCIVFEQLSMNLYDVLKQNSFRGLPVNMIKSITDQLLRALVCLQTQGIIHCDLKPENILLVTKRNTKIKLIDFGSAAFSGYQVYTYIQSRFYRSPDVILGIHPFTTAIDMWSLGCILAELFLGLPLFPGSSEKDQLTRIVALMGSVPCRILDKGRNTGKFYFPVEVEETLERPSTDEAAAAVLSRRLRILGEVDGPGIPASMTKTAVDPVGDVGIFSVRFGQESVAEGGEDCSQMVQRTGLGFKLKSRREYEETTGKRENPSRKYSRYSTLREMIMQAPMKAGLPQEQLNEETLRRERILHLIKLCLDYDPTSRITPAQALTHPLFVDDGRPGAGLPTDWLPRSAELCLMNLIDDTSSFLHNSSSRPPAEVNDSAPATPYRQRGNGGYSPSCGGGLGSRQRSESIYSNTTSPSQVGGPSGGLRGLSSNQPVHVGSAPAASFMMQVHGGGGTARQQSRATTGGMAVRGLVSVPMEEVNNKNKAGIPLPDDTMPVSYRPALHKVPDSYFQGFIHGKYLMSSGHPLPLGVSPPANYSRLQHQMHQQQHTVQAAAHRGYTTGGAHNAVPSASQPRGGSGHGLPHRSPGGPEVSGSTRTHDMMYSSSHAKGSVGHHQHQQLAAGLYGSKPSQARHGGGGEAGPRGLQTAQSRSQQIYQSPSPGVSVHSSGSHGQYGQRQQGLGSSSILQQAGGGHGRVHMQIAAHHRRLGGSNRDRVSPFSQHSSCSSDSFDDPAFAGISSQELSYMPPAGSEWCPLVSGSNTPLQPSASAVTGALVGAGYATQAGGAYVQQEALVAEIGNRGTRRGGCLDPSPLRTSSGVCDVMSPMVAAQGTAFPAADDATDLGIYIQEQLQQTSPGRGTFNAENPHRQQETGAAGLMPSQPYFGDGHRPAERKESSEVDHRVRE